MKKKSIKAKITHTTIRNQNLFCMNCGGEQVIPYPIQIPMMTAMMEAFNKMHKSCKPEWKQPEVNQGLAEAEKAVWWSNYGEHGTSSKTMFSVLSPVVTSKATISVGGYDHPHDPGDFRRCYVLLKTIPEWRDKLDKMRNVSDVWSRLVDNWDKLTLMLEEEMKSDDDKNPSAMMKFMNTLKC